MSAAPITEKFVAALTEKFPDEFAPAIKPGRRFDKVYIHMGQQKSVHCFVERATGLVYKAASWSSPAEDPRYDLIISGGFEATVEAANWNGSYLYKR